MDPETPAEKPWFRPVGVSAPLRSELATAWIVDSTDSHDLVPDACVDVVWTADGKVRICGPETRGWTFRISGRSEAVGVRFHPGHAGPALGLELGEIRNLQVPAEQVLRGRDRFLAEELWDARGPAGRLRVLESHAERWIESSSGIDPLADQVVRILRLRPAAEVSELARQLALSERQLLRRCTAIFGYGPATLRRILRLQSFLQIAEAPLADQSLAFMALAAGFFDQQHLAREARAIGRATPTELVVARRAR